MAAQPLIIKQWAQAMGDSPQVGNGLIRNASIDVESGALMPNYAPSKISAAASASTFTADAATDLCTLTGTFAALATNVAVTFSSTGTLPAGLVAGTTYFIIKKSATTFKVATCIKNCGGGNGTGFAEVDVDITGAGTGVHTMTTVNVGPIGGVTVVVTPDLFISGLPFKVVFYIDTNGRVWFYDAYHYGSVGGLPDQLLLLTGNSLSLPKGNGIGSFQTSNINKRYIFTFRQNAIDVCDIRSITYMCDPVGNSAWNTGWQVTTSINDASQQMIVGDDNIMYFCNGQYVGSIQEIPTKIFNPTDATTYTFNEAALTLPQGEVSLWLEQLGINLLVAGGSFNNIYPWDRSSASFDLPIKCAERGVYRLKNINNTIFILSGIRGNIYKTQGAIVQLARKLPEYVTGTGNPNVAWGGIGQKSGNLIFGVSAANNSANSGIWMLYPDGRLVVDNQPSGGAAQVTAIADVNDEFYNFGYSGGVDLIGTTRYGSFGTVYQSPLYGIAPKTEKMAYSKLEVQLTRPTSGTSSVVRVSYRTSLSGSFTTLATFTTDGTSFSFQQDIGLTDLQNIQIQVEITGTGSNDEALQVFEVRLFP